MMEKVTLEKVDQIIERTAVTYADAKIALEACDGDVLESIIFIENKSHEEYLAECEILESKDLKKQETVQDLKRFLLSLVEKGNVSRIRIKKDEQVISDIPVNAGIAASVIAVLLPPVLAVLAVAAVASKIVIEITKTDGSVEVVNKIVKGVAINLRDKSKGFAGMATNIVKSKTSILKSKTQDIENRAEIIEALKSIKKSNPVSKSKDVDNSTNFSYTVEFDDLNN